jgi:low temperature requirement protein LtrA
MRRLGLVTDEMLATRRLMALMVGLICGCCLMIPVALVQIGAGAESAGVVAVLGILLGASYLAPLLILDSQEHWEDADQEHWEDAESDEII